MICHPRSRPRRPARHAHPAPEAAPVPPAAPIVSAFRRADDTICHGRCGHPLSLQGVRGLLEADFYCYSCLAHVTLPLIVLNDLPVAASARAIVG